jgi:hypothetical protein
MDDDYIFRQELDWQTNIPKMIVHLKKDPLFCKMDMAYKKELYDVFYAVANNIFLSNYLSGAEKNEIELAVTHQMMERAREAWEKTLIKAGYYDG